MNLSKFIHTTTGGYLSSVILGIGLSCLFRKLCKNGDCIVYKAPPSTDILGNIFECLSLLVCMVLSDLHRGY